jgi:hypothetical protein
VTCRSKLRQWTARAGRRRSPALLPTAVLGLAVAFMVPGTAFAGQTVPPDGTKSVVNNQTVVHRCVLYANEVGFGADCVGGDSGGVTIKQLLHGEKFPECRFVVMTGDISPPSTHDGEKGTWYLKNCLKGIKDDGTGDFTRTIEFAWVPDGTPVPTLTPNQSAAWNTYRTAYPEPTPQFGPAAQPRVLIPTYFWLTAETGATIEHTVFDGTRDVLMRAHVERIKITPGGYKDETTFGCDAPVPPYNPRKGIFEQDSTCSYEYARSSAIAPDKTFDVIVEADWVVQYQLADGTMELLGRVPLTSTAVTAVDEIQTVVG